VSLNGFHPLISEWFLSKIGQPTDIQAKSWPKIKEQEHLLITAPTGSGKTLTAFLWALNQLITGAWETGTTRVLYISPLKALNNDIRRNLLSPLQDLAVFFESRNEPFPEIRVFTRSGDTPQNERQKMRRQPPEILITTPESLNILLTTKSCHSLLKGVQTVILDEIHAVVNTKRGTHLMTAIDRLVLLAGEFQRLALSATVRPLETVAKFVGGYRLVAPKQYDARKVTIIQSDIQKKYALRVDFPAKARQESKDNSWWPVLAKAFKGILKQNQSTLIFSNSRRHVEKISRLINEDEEDILAYAHHGSLSKEIRLTVEQKLKAGELRGIVATNSLELGIDIGSLDEVILVETPFNVASAVQRLGRAGHRVGEVSRGRLYPIHGGDFLHAAVMTKAVLAGNIEEVHPISGALDVLTQVILSMCVVQTWDIDELYDVIRTNYAYHHLSRQQFDLILQMLEGRYANTRIRELSPRLSVDRLDNTVKAKDNAAFLIYMAGGTIPDRGYYDLRLENNKAKIGTLDEEFVWERRVGETFALGNQIWRIMKITHNDVEVMPAEGTLNIIPFWNGEAMDSDFHFSRQVSNFLKWAQENLGETMFKEQLMTDYHMVEPAANELIRYLKSQQEEIKTDLPHSHHIVVEHFQDPTNQKDAKQVIIYTFWGGKVNRPFALALSMAWEEKFKTPLQVFIHNDAILLMLPSEFNAMELLRLITPENMEQYLVKKLEQTGFFGAHFRENAGRSLLLPRQNFRKRMPLWLNRLRSKKLLQTIRSFEDFPVLLETWRTCLQDEFDLANLKSCLEKIQTHEIRVSETATQKPSPFASGLIWQQTNQYMYDNDTPLGANQVSLKGELIRELVQASHLRPKIPVERIQELEAKRQRYFQGYAPDNASDLFDHIKDRLLIPQSEWKTLCQGITRDHQIDWQDLLEDKTVHLSQKIIFIQWGAIPEPLLVAVENVPRFLQLFKKNMAELTVLDYQGKAYGDKLNVPKASPVTQESTRGDENSSLVEELALFIGQWLSFYGPLTQDRICGLLGLQGAVWQEILEELVDNEQVIFDEISINAIQKEVCDITNLEVLLRMLRRSQQPQFTARPIQELPLFLATFQGIVRKGESASDLQRLLEQFLGMPLNPHLWEEQILPNRLVPYFSAWLDSLVQEHGLLLMGNENKKLYFSFPDDLELYVEQSLVQEDKEPPPFQIQPTGRYHFLDLLKLNNCSSTELGQGLWQQFWKGHITVDSFGALRKAILNQFSVEPQTPASSNRRSRRPSHRRWQSESFLPGNWYKTPVLSKNDDSIYAEELNKDRVRQLLERYGILFRELLQRELPLFQWRSIFRTLQLMEYSGEVLAGYFFEHIPGLQFISHEAFECLKQGLNKNTIFWVNAVDPASVCGLSLEPLKANHPSRLQGNYVVYDGHTIVLVIQKSGKALYFHVPPDHSRLQDYFAVFKMMLERDFNPQKSVVIETINDTTAVKSEYLPALKAFGFQNNYDRLELWRRYA
jgi:ATP-dependent Lhr-like helicase